MFPIKSFWLADWAVKVEEKPAQLPKRRKKPTIELTLTTSKITFGSSSGGMDFG